MRRAGTHPSLARTALRFVQVGLLLVAVLPALATAVFGWFIEFQRAQASARTVAWMVEQWPPIRSAVSADSVAAGADAVSLARLPALYSEGEARDILAPDGQVVASGGDDQARNWPTLVIERDLTRGDKTVGRVHIVRSLRPTLALALVLLLAGSVLAMGLWVLTFMRSIGAMRQNEGRLRNMAHHDTLTGLYNHDGLRHRMHRALARRESGSRTAAVLVVDLDRFRIVNDSLGLPCGDALLRSVADRIRAVTRPADVVARLGADQFGILVEGIGGAAAAANMARNLLRALAPSYLLGGSETTVGLSIGVAIASDELDGVDALLTAAEAAMRAAKAGGGGRFKLYEATMYANVQQRLNLEADLRRALQRGEFFVLFQPIMDANGKSVTAVEALVRWADPGRGTVSPTEFIPVLEETGLIVSLGRWVLSEACRSACEWRGDGGAELVMSVNVSPRQFAEPDFVQMVLQVLTETGFPARQLQLEVTEGLLLEPTPDTEAKIDELTQLGIRLAIDDFGIGYSSLAYLKRYNLYALKIDRMFVRDIASASQDAAIVRAIIDLGHGLGMRVTAEGVETEAQCHELRRLGCDSMQGYLFARPMPEAELRLSLGLPEDHVDSLRMHATTQTVFRDVGHQPGFEGLPKQDAAAVRAPSLDPEQVLAAP